MDVEIMKMDGSKVKLSDIGVKVRDFIVSSIELRPTYAAVTPHVDEGLNDLGARRRAAWGGG